MRVAGRVAGIGLVLLCACGLTISGSAPGGGGTDDGTKEAGGADGAQPADDAASDGAAADDAGDAADETLDAAVDVDAGPLHAQSALDFAANKACVDTATTIAIPADFTLEAWIRPSSVANEMMIAAEDRSGDGNDQFRLAVAAGGAVYFLMSDDAGSTHGLYTTTYQLITTAKVGVATWTHVAVTKSGVSFHLFLDGVSSVAANATSDFTHGGTNPFRIAGRNGSGNSAADTFSGDVDEVRLWNIARSEADIAADMSTELTTSHPKWANLVGYWRFDEGTGTIAHDATAGAHNGTLINGPTWIASTAF